jgi:hypothetical protein
MRAYSEDRKKKQCQNLVYRLRKKGLRINVKEMCVYRFCEMILLPADIKQMRRLQKEFGFNIQLTWW